MIRPPPRPTLFPYPTLFRSSGAAIFIHVFHRRSPCDQQFNHLLVSAEHGPVNTRHAIDLQVRIETGDRKSTRLNSSHVEISYAVFCLKKKKTQRHTEGVPVK